MKTGKLCAIALLLVGGTLGLAGCADDGYGRDRTYTSMSFGVSSGGYGDGYYRDGRYNRWRDSDGDGVPNRYDSHPYDPNWH